VGGAGDLGLLLDLLQRRLRRLGGLLRCLRLLLGGALRLAAKGVGELGGLGGRPGRGLGVRALLVGGLRGGGLLVPLPLRLLASRQVLGDEPVGLLAGGGRCGQRLLADPVRLRHRLLTLRGGPGHRLLALSRGRRGRGLGLGAGLVGGGGSSGQQRR